MKHPTCGAEIKVIPQNVKQVVYDYIKTHPAVSIGELIAEFGADPDLVASVVQELKEEEKIRGTFREVYGRGYYPTDKDVKEE